MVRPLEPSSAKRPGVRFQPAPFRARRVIAVGGGKGGIGKSLISASLGLELARRGRSVALLDFDLGGANLHTCLGIERPQTTLSDFVLRRAERLEDVSVPGGVPGLTLVSGAGDALSMANPMHQQKLRLLRAVQSLDVDVALMDLGAGSHNNVLDFFLFADHGLITVVPEPTSVENAYRFLKAAFYRLLRALESVYGIDEIVEQAAREHAQKVPSPAELVELVRRRDERAGAELESVMRGFRPLVVANQVRDSTDLSLGEGVCAAWRRFFGLELGYLGFVRHDPSAWELIRARRPVLLERADSPLALDVAALAEKLLAMPPPRRGGES